MSKKIYRYGINTGDWNGWTNYFMIAETEEEVKQSEEYLERKQQCERAKWDFIEVSEISSEFILAKLGIFQRNTDTKVYKINYTIEENEIKKE